MSNIDCPECGELASVTTANDGSGVTAVVCEECGYNDVW